MNRPGTVPYSESSLLRDARAEYLRHNGLGEDGGYGKRWVKVKLGPITSDVFVFVCWVCFIVLCAALLLLVAGLVAWRGFLWIGG